MPRSGVIGTYSLPPNTNNQAPNTPISSSMFNSFASDVQQTFNDPTPVAYGGTGAATAGGARAELGVDFYDGAMSLTAEEQGQARANIGADVLGGFRNKIINGDFDVWQRATSQSAFGYGADDRWFNTNVGGSFVASQQVFSLGQTDVEGNPTFFSRFIVTHEVGAGNYHLKAQRVEGVRTLAGRKATLTFYAKADAPKNMAVELVQSFGTGGSPSAQVTGIGSQSCALTTSWQKFSLVVDIPTIAGKSLGTDGNDYLTVNFWFEAGATFNARTAGIGQQSGTFDLSHISLVEGDASAETDPFSPRHIQQELALCQRYYEQVTIGIIGNAYTGTAFVGTMIPWKVSKRVAPTVSFQSETENINATERALGPITRYGVRAYVKGITAGNVAYVVGAAADAEL